MALVSVFNNDFLYELERSDRHESSYFGGPSEVLIEGMPRHSYPLHHVVTIVNRDIDLGTLRFGFKTPFLYGLRNEGCELSYQRTATAAINVTSLSPESSEDDCPYAGYPDLLPYVPLRLSKKTPCSSEDLSGSIYNTGWTARSGRLYVIVSNPADIGFTMWAPSVSDSEVVFEYEPDTGLMRACCQCT